MDGLKQIDGITSKVIDDLRERLMSGSRVSVAASAFSIYAFEALKSELEKIEDFRFIFTSPTFHTEKSERQKREFYIPKLNRERTLYGSEFEIRLRNQLSQKAIARECADWIRSKAVFRTNVTSATMQSFLHISEGTDDGCAYLPFNEFTTTELGIEKGNNLFPLVTRMDYPHSQAFIDIFNNLWKDTGRLADVTDAVLENIETVYSENSPDFIYFITLYNIFSEFLDDISEDVLPNEATGFKDSVIWNRLYDFQKDAALAVINKLETYNGCILADSVGLGKTWTALAVIKYYEARNKSVLVLCPKKLNDNWNSFTQNYRTNPLWKDRFGYHILFHTDLSRDHGTTNGIDLSKVNWANYDLVVIDESHNFRNGGRMTADDEEDESPKENRYLKLLNSVIRAGVRTKVLMLSATPVNNRFNDLKNQLALAYEGESENLNRLLDTSNSIETIFRQAQKAYNVWSKLPVAQRTTKALIASLDFDFFKVLDAVTIARSRKHIEKYYDIAAVGRFPERLAPISKRPALTDIPGAITYNGIYALISSLTLAVYSPSDFLLASYRDEDEESGLSVSGREKGMRRLMAINILKRLESSVNSFRLTLERILKMMEQVSGQIEHHSEGLCRIDYDPDMYIVDEDGEDGDMDSSADIDLEKLDYISWKRYIDGDIEIISEILRSISVITPDRDVKLQTLLSDIEEKIKNPINGENRKVIVFTAFADTAEYIYRQLSPKIRELGLESALVTGRGCSSTVRNVSGDFSTLLTLFSPVSKECDTIFPHEHRRIDVLIATDCISEGQNLQDCDWLINFDIHWNPVRIIQRFGRIDRIGSRNSVIQLVNYWPDVTLDDYINLKGRVEARMKVSVMTASGDENPLTTEEQGDLEYRRRQLERLQKEVVDIEDLDSGVSIMDLGLNEFRLDLLSYMKDNHDIEHTPFGMSAVVPHSDIVPPGVIFVLKNRTPQVNIARKNILHPFYMVHIGYDGQVICDHLKPKQLLDTMRAACREHNVPYMSLCGEFNRETSDGRRMKRYSSLLSDAITSIIEVKQESDMASFLSGTEGDIFGGEIRGLDDFELICFLVIR